jgi:phytoene dehydrogenase-like protein
MSDHFRETFDVVVIGGGLAGLAAAATAAKAGQRTVLLEGHTPGGRATTDERRGFKFNQGAHAVYLGGAGNAVLGRLGVTHRGHPPIAGGTHGLVGDDVSPLPFSPAAALKSQHVSFRGKAQVAKLLGLGVNRIDTTTLADRSAEAWLADLGLRDDATAVIRTVMRVACFSDDLAAISADAAVRQLQLAVKPGVSYLDGGWQTLVDGLLGAALTAGADVRAHHLVFAIEPDGRAWVVRTGGDEMGAVRGRTVIVAGLAPQATAALLPGAPEWTGLGPATTVACLDLGTSRVPSVPVLFGVDRPLYFSTHCPPGDLAPRGRAVVHLMRYGTTKAEADRAELVDLARRAGVADGDIVEQRFLARMVVAHATPVPGSGLRGRPAVDATGAAGVFVAGDWVAPDGMLSDATLASAEAAARAAVTHAAKVAA